MSPGVRELYDVELDRIKQDANSIWGLIHPDDLPQFQETVARSAETLELWKHQWRNYTASGKLKWLSGIAQPERHANGDIVWDGFLLDISQRKQAERDLNRFFDCGLDLFGIIGFDGYFKHLNPAWENVLGYSLDELKAQPFINFVHPDDLAATEAEAVRIGRGEPTQWFENRYRTRDGGYRWLGWKAMPFSEEGVMYASARDITERKRAEGERERLIAIIEASPDLISTTDLSGTLTYMNRGGRTLLGLDAEEDISQYRIGDFVPEEVVQYFGEVAIPQALERGFWQGQSRLCRRDGDGFPTAQTIVSHGTENDGTPYLSTVVRDVSDVRAIEAQLRQQEQFLRTIYDNQSNIVFLVDVEPDERLYFRGWNAVTEAITGIPSDRAQGKASAELFPPAIAESFERRYRQGLAARETITYEEFFPREDGELWFQVSLTPVFDKVGTIRQLVGTATDITERKQAALALQASEAKYRALAQKEKLVNRLAQQIRQSLDLQSILQTAVREIYLLLGVDRCYFLWYREREAQPYFELGAEFHRDDLPSRLDRDPGNFDEILAGVLQQQQLLRLDNVADLDDVPMRERLEAFNYRSLLLLPIETGSGNLGVLACTREVQPQPWCDRDIELLRVVCDRLAIAVQQAVLYQQSRDAELNATAKTHELEATLRRLQTTQAQLVQAEKMSGLGQMVAGVAHEINNPVGFVFGNLIHAREYAEDLLELIALYERHTSEPHPEIAAFVEQVDLDYLRQDLPQLFASIENGAVRIRDIVRSLRTFSRLDESEQKAVDLHESLDSTLTILASRLRATDGRREIQVVRHYGALPPVNCYAGQLNQVFMNLLANAIDAVEEREDDPRQILIETRAIAADSGTAAGGDRQISIAITDNGAGMSPSVCDRIFDPFYTTKPIGKGTGLGLSVSYQIVVERHGGSLTCHSTPGEGTTFTVVLPIA